MKKLLARSGLVAAAMVAAASANATVQVGMTLNDPGQQSYSEAGFTATLNGNSLITGNDLIGVYSFTVNSVTPSGSLGSISIPFSPFYSTCLSPAGSLNWNQLNTYTMETFAEAGTGTYPSDWVTPSGIQNANWLFKTFAGNSATILSAGGLQGTSYDKGAALALAMYKVLYDSTGYGTYNSSATSKFNITGGMGSALSALNQDYGFYLAALASFDGSGQLPVGYILRPSGAPGAQQDMILLASSVPETTTAVPEPATVIAGALLLLPFGAGALRIVRKNRAV